MKETSSSSKIEKENLFIRFLKIRELGAIVPLVIIIIITSSINKDFYSFANILNMLRSASYLFIPAIGMTFILSSRGLDLSVGSQIALSGVMLGAFTVYLDLPVWLSIILCLISGAIVGSFNGLMIAFIGIPPFIATLGTLYLYRGLVYVITKGVPIHGLPETLILIGQGKLFGISYTIYFMVITAIIASFVLNKTRYGRYLLAKGGDEESARLAGINTKLITFSTYLIIGVLSFFSGILFSGRFQSIQVNVGDGTELRIITACIIGGVSLFGGSGSIIGTLFGVFFLVTLDNSMSMVRISGYWKMAILGIIILVAIIIDIIRRSDFLKRK